MPETKLSRTEDNILRLSTSFDALMKVTATLRFVELSYQFAEYPEALERLRKLSAHEERIYSAGNALCKIAIELHRELVNMQFENNILREDVAKLTAQLEKPL